MFRVQPARNTTTGAHCSGFTLIELVLVIVILGSLSSIALPKFVNIKSDAVVAATQSMKNSVVTAATNTRMLCAAKPSCDLSSINSPVSLSGTNITMRYGWPDAGDSIGVNGIDLTVQATGFTVSIVNARTRWVHPSAKDINTCYVDYQEATALGDVPNIDIVTTGC